MPKRVAWPSPGFCRGAAMSFDREIPVATAGQALLKMGCPVSRGLTGLADTSQTWLSDINSIPAGAAYARVDM